MSELTLSMINYRGVVLTLSMINNRGVGAVGLIIGVGVGADSF